MKRLRFVLAATVLLLIPAMTPAQAHAQVPWDTPFQMGPGLSGGLGIHLVDFDTSGVDDGLGAMVTWRQGAVPGGMGLRFGLAEGFADDLAVFGGVDFSGFLARETAEFPMDLIWATGLGAGAGDHVLLSFPASLVIGRAFDADGVRFVPYFGPRLDLDAYLGRPEPAGDDLDLAFTVDLGADIVISERATIRFAAAVGGDESHEALSIGLVLPGVR
ncbi:MAG: hypothetical protein R3223_01165 [Longimicrobiales bacterium]|nr:hypothetical protein [Longimicrobiales bacterium]